MKIWLIQIGEILPIKEKSQKMRTALLADKLMEKGHDILWWASAFDHFHKRWIFTKDTEIKLQSKLTIKALKGIGYSKNISLRRFIDHRIISWKFKKMSSDLLPPDVIVASTPSYDLAYQAVKFAKKNNIPIIIDIRDMWPDIFEEHVPKKLRKLVSIILYRDFRMLKYALENATCLVSMMESILDWGLKKTSRKKTKYDKVFYLGAKKTFKIIPKFKCLQQSLKDKFIVVFIGTFGKYCNPIILTHAARKLAEYNIHFILGGDGIFFNEVKKAAQGLFNLILTGWLSEEEISYILSLSHVGVVPCNNPTGAFPNKVFSYLSAGLPIISSTKGELKKIIQEHQIGFYYPPNNIEVLVNFIKKLYEDRKLYEGMANNARELFSKMFDADKIYEEYADYIEKVVYEKYKN